MPAVTEKVKRIPSLLPLLFFTAGILVEDLSERPFNDRLLQMILIFSAIYLILPVFFSLRFPYPVSDVMLILSFGIAGILHSSAQEKKIPVLHQEFFLAEAVTLPVVKPASFLIQLRYLGNPGKFITIKNKLYVNSYFSRDHLEDIPRPGDIILLKAKLKEIPEPGNPEEFNYKKYLGNKNILYSCYVEKGKWTRTHLPPVTGKIKRFSLEMKDYLQKRIKEIAKNFDLPYEVLLAICTGDKTELGPQVKNAYSDAGAIHVMAVSGLHVGLIWVFLNYLTFFLTYNKMERIIQFLLVTLILWFYALMTGFSPSVIRACFMFSLASVSGFLKRKYIVFNTFMISALVQEIIEPEIICNPGFQFSYLAVLGILLFDPPLKTLFNSNRFIINRITDMLRISISAQILTFPLAAFYFHKFPVYFLITNLIVIPLVTLLMVFFLSSLILFFIPFISDLFLYFSLKISLWMGYFIELINSLPGSIIRNIYLVTPQLILLIVFPLMLLIFYYTRKYFVLFSSGIILLLILVTDIKNYQTGTKPALCVFDVSKGAAISIVHSGRNLLLYNNNSDLDRIKYISSNYLIKKHRATPELVNFSVTNAFNGFYTLPGNNNFSYLAPSVAITFIGDNSIFSGFSPEKKFRTKFLILACHPLPRFDEINEHFYFCKLIITANIPSYIPDIDLPDSLSPVYHRISELGAFISDL